MSAQVELERSGATARIWLNRPEQHNALSSGIIGELGELLHQLGHDDSVRVIVLGGRGPSFCAGADIGALKEAAGYTFDENVADAQRLGGLFAMLSDIAKPVVGRIHGHVLGGGVGLACACDITVASDDATFGLTEVRLGILPALISPYVIRRMGDRNAREYMLTGERFGAAKALQLGIVQHVVAPEELDNKVEDRVLALMAGGPKAQGRIKTLLELWADSTWEEYRSALPRILAEVREGEEARDGLASFFEKRKPSWRSE